MSQTVSADKIIGKGLIARVRMPAYDGSLTRIQWQFEPNDPIGTVYSYVQDRGKLYWMIWDRVNNKKPFYVEHGQGRFVITDAIRQAIRQQRLETQNLSREEEIKIKGAIPYYFEKYGIWVLGAIAVIALGREYIKKKA